jgi:hypothetical protein
MVSLLGLIGNDDDGLLKFMLDLSSFGLIR